MMIDDIVTRLREQALEGIWDFTQASFDMQNAADEIERLRTELFKWATTPPNRIVCVTHGEMFMCFDEYMGNVYWCEGCRNG
jgi:hypothetical protein